MKTCARPVFALVALGASILLAGCATTRTSRAVLNSSVYNFTVVESSTDREMTPHELDQLRQGVARYLESEGVARSGQYYVRVDFAPATPDSPGEWAIVRLTAQAAPSYTLVAAYPAADMGMYYYPTDFRYSGYSYWNYYDPFDYNYGSYSRPTHYRPHVPPRQPKPGDKDYCPPGTTATNGSTPGTNVNRPHSPSVNPPRGTHRLDRPPTTENVDYRPPARQPDRVRTPGARSDSPPVYRDRSGDRSGGGNTSPRPERTYSSPPERSYSPPPERSYSPPASSESSSRRSETVSVPDQHEK